ncbi:5-deoxy-glucuronate isomerase [soil metagenome]
MSTFVRPEDRLLRKPIPGDSPGGLVQSINAAEAGWRYVGFTVRVLEVGEGLQRAADDHEVTVVALEGSLDVRAGSQSFESLGTRADVFDGPPAELALVAPGEPIEVVARTAATVVVADAPGGDVRVTRGLRAVDILVEHRGDGVTARRIHHLLPPAAQAGRLILFEVYTPGGTWSSYPPHKHDTQDPPTESALEELYYYRFARPSGWAFQRIYTPDRDLDAALAPTDGDVVLVPRGYHTVGMPAGYDGYYLNVMAGPTREWHFTLDPDHAWLMDWDPSAPREG